MTGDKRLKIEKAKPQYLDQIKEIETECGLSFWSPADYRRELERDDSFFYVCKSNDRIAGFILARLITAKENRLENIEKEINFTKTNGGHFTEAAENFFVVENAAEIFNIGVRKEYRRMRIGTMLFESLYKKSKQNNVKKIRLEVRASNKKAVGFYESKEFLITGIRKNLYTNPAEDGFVMCLDI